jgi:hypothetical protein
VDRKSLGTAALGDHFQLYDAVLHSDYSCVFKSSAADLSL